MADQIGKVVLDLDKLVESGDIKRDLAKRLAQLKEPAKATHYLVSVLYIIGALAAAAGVVLLKPIAATGLLIGFVCLIAGQLIIWRKIEHLHILALALGIGSAAGFIGWFALEFGETLPALWVNGFATAVTLINALLFRSRFLAALVPLGIGTMIGSGGGYWHAAYAIFVREAAITVVLFTTLSAGLFWMAHRRFNIATDWGFMSLVASRVSLIVANFGFWVGSLWGDHVGEHLAGFTRYTSAEGNYENWKVARNAFRESTIYINDDVFALAWALFAILTIVIGQRMKERFIALTGVVFLAINAFTQYFEFFKDEPWALIIGGIILVATALILLRLQANNKLLGAFGKVED